MNTNKFDLITKKINILLTIGHLQNIFDLQRIRVGQL